MSEHIENTIKGLINCKKADAKKQQYDLIADGLTRYFKNTGIKRFSRDLIISFFDAKQYPATTQNRHIKEILKVLFMRGTISEGKTTKTYFSFRPQELKSNDGESYFSLMKANGYSRINFYKFKVDKNGVPRRQKVGSCLIGEDYDGEEFDISEVEKSRKSQKNQGVLSYGNKSIIRAKQQHEVKTFFVN